MSEGLGAGWTASFLAKVYPGLSRYLIREFLKAVTELSIVVILGLFVMFKAENFVKGPGLLFTEGMQNLRLDGLLTLNIKVRQKRSWDSWNKIRDLRHTLIQYLLQQNRFETGEDNTTERRRGCATSCRVYATTNRFKPSYGNRSHSTDQRDWRVCDGDIRSGSDVQIP